MPDLDALRDCTDDTTRFEVVGYPGWKRYVTDGFSAEVLIADLAAQIATRVPQGSIRIVGLSIGGHFGYAAALHLQSMGREIAGFCAIDTFMFTTKPSAGWKGRAFAQGLELLRGLRFGEFARFFAIEVLANSGQTGRELVAWSPPAIIFFRAVARAFSF